MGVPEYQSPSLPRIDPNGYKRALRERRSSYDPRFASGVWRLLELLPPLPPESIVTLGEGNVPLYDAPSGARYAGVDALAYLHLGMNPTGSFKDLGMTVAISAAKAAGARGVACASTGNTASSMAAYAARAGLKAYALIPRGRISRAKLAQILDYGAEIVEVEGSFDDAFDHLATLEGELAIVNSINPYRIEGQKCSAYAILEARQWRVPDWVVVPGGNLGNSSAIGKGFREALALGLIDRLPRLAVVQASGAAPFARAFESGVDLVPVEAHTRASAIAVGSPKSWRQSLHEVHSSRGIVLAVDDDAIDEAKAEIGREGIGCEPASAATLAGLRALRHGGAVAPEADVVAVLTGHVLKDTDASLRIAESHRKADRAAV
jgi:threonine synthase